MRSPPVDLVPERLGEALAEGWLLRAASMEYVPEGGGSYHWKLTGEDGQAHFVTVDDLDDKNWMGDTRAAVCEGLRRALDMIATLHQSTPAVQGRAPRHVPRFAGRGDLNAFLLDPDHPWDGGPFSEPARRLLVTRTADLAQLTAGFDRLVDFTIPARAHPVITHGEPHPANLMSVDGRLVLIDWDTAALAPPERDVSLIATTGHEGVDRYQEATGRELDPAVVTLYRLRWYLDDIASAVRLFRNRHLDTPDTRRWRDGLAPRLEQLPRWLDLLG